ncbi:MAG: D-cysteine desulfhydrase family protein [Phycisphaerae bacterium]|nr:D-cysteine desulfhydrase family protein [Phycisphaerae bacterium]
MFEPERVPLANLPTPLVRLERLGAALAGAEVWVKRDDLTGLEVSGNKVRKLEYIAAEALASGCDTLVTEGTSQSNHCRATAAVCARLGMQAVLLFRPAAPELPQGNHLLDVLFGAQTRSFPRPEYAAQRERIIADVLAELKAAGRKPRFTPAGSSEPLGCWGYLRAARELAEQLQAAGIGECDVLVAISSGATYAGLLLGRMLHRLDSWRLWAVPVSDNVAEHTAKATELCQEAVARYDLPVQFDAGALAFIDGYVGEGYAVPYPAEIEGLRLLAHTEAIVLDPVYTGKAFCALLDGIRSRRFGFDRPVVFIHTGGIFSDFAWPRLFLESV